MGSTVDPTGLAQRALIGAFNAAFISMEREAHHARGAKERERMLQHVRDFRDAIQRARWAAMDVKATAANRYNVYSIIDARRLGPDLDDARRSQIEAADVFISAAGQWLDAQTERVRA